MAGYIPRWFTGLQAVTHPCSHRAQCWLTTLIKTVCYHLHWARWLSVKLMLIGWSTVWWYRSMELECMSKVDVKEDMKSFVPSWKDPYGLWVKCGIAECGMRNRKCGMTLIGRTVKPRDRCHSAYYRKSAMTSQIGRAVKCGMRKIETMKQDCVVDRAHIL